MPSFRTMMPRSESQSNLPAPVLLGEAAVNTSRGTSPSCVMEQPSLFEGDIDDATNQIGQALSLAFQQVDLLKAVQHEQAEATLRRDCEARVHAAELRFREAEAVAAAAVAAHPTIDAEAWRNEQAQLRVRCERTFDHMALLTEVSPQCTHPSLSATVDLLGGA